MARPRTPGIGMDRNGGRIIDKEHRGKGIYLGLGPISQEHAEQRLADEIARANAELERNASPRPRFADCAARYLEQSKNKRSVGATAWHVRLLTSYIGNLDVHRIHWRPLSLTDWRQASRLRQLTAAWKSCVPY